MKTLMIVMAFIEFSKSRFLKFTSWLWLFLSGGVIAGTQIRCSSEEERKDTMTETVDTVDAVDTAPDEWNDVLYGCPECFGEDGSFDAIPEILYGPPPSDVVETTSEDLQIQPLYGISSDVVETTSEDLQIQPLYGISSDVVETASEESMPQPEYGVPIDK